VLYDFMIVVAYTVGSVAAAAVLTLGFAFLIFLGDANARGKPLVSDKFDQRAMVVVYVSWFSLLWWFGITRTAFMIACGAAVVLCLIYAASYQAAVRGRGARHEDWSAL
jgi:hypothetical protein